MATHRFRNWCTLLALSSLPSFVRRTLARASVVLVVGALAGRMRDAIRRRRASTDRRRSEEHAVLPSLFERHPGATRVPRRSVGLRSVSLDAIVGTMRHPSQNTADFLPLPRLRGENWRGRWQRLVRATDRLAMLPPIDLVQVGDEYYVADGHNRVAVARRAGALEIDADVTQLLVPGVTRPEPLTFDATSLYGAHEVRQAAGGRLLRTLEHRAAEDLIPRRDLAPDPDDDRAGGSE